MKNKEYEYPFSDDVGDYCYRTLGGRRVKIYKKYGIDGSMKLSKQFPNNKSRKIETLKKQLESAKGFLAKTKIQNEIIALENGFDSYEEYQNDKNKKMKERALIKTSDGKEYKVIEKELNEFVRKRDIDINDWQNSDSLLQENYSKERGLDGNIKVINRDEYLKIDGVELSRVITGKSKANSNELIKNTINGEIKYSDERNSYYGKGIYFGDSKIENKLIKEYGNKNSSLMKCKISKEATIIELNDMQDYLSSSNKLARGINDSSLCTFYNNPAKNRNILYMNAGIDIIKIKRENYYIVLNRGVLITYDE